MQYDLIIIGSGFGGAVAACRAAAAGMRVLVLERGRRFNPAVWRDVATGRTPIVDWTFGRRQRRVYAPIEVRTMPGLTAIVGSALGGGSHHYTSATVQAPDEIFAEGWPIDWTLASMENFYASVAERLRPQTVEIAFVQTAALEDIARRTGAQSRRLPLALELQGGPLQWSTNWRETLALWMQSPCANKHTLDKVYLEEATANGAEICTGHAVNRIGAIRAGYRIEYTFFDGIHSRRGTAESPRVVLAAGTIHTVRLLLEARDIHRSLPNISPVLGTRFSANGDYGAILLGPHANFCNWQTLATTAWLDFWEKDRLFLMELGKLPLLEDWLYRWLPPVLRLRDRGRPGAAPVAWMIGGYGLGSRGQLHLTRTGQLACDTPRMKSDFDARMVTRLQESARACGATLLRLPLALTRRHPITVHPLGGCTLADSPACGVCDSRGEVFGHPGLYVADGSVLPAPLGVPPSMTISAAAERIVEGLIADAKIN